MGAYATGRCGADLRYACNPRQLRPDANAGQWVRGMRQKWVFTTYQCDAAEQRAAVELVHQQG